MTATDRAVELVTLAAGAAADKLATDIIAYDVSEQLVITDAFLLCSAANDRQVKAIVDDIEDKLRKSGELLPCKVQVFAMQVTNQLEDWATAIPRLGIPDYQTYVEHRRACHPNECIMSYQEFFRDRQDARYSTGNGRNKNNRTDQTTARRTPPPAQVL